MPATLARDRSRVMTATQQTVRRYACGHCDDVFANPVRLGGHVHAKHPDHKRPLPKILLTPAKPRKRRDHSLKRDTDRWPGRP